MKGVKIVSLKGMFMFAGIVFFALSLTSCGITYTVTFTYSPGSIFKGSPGSISKLKGNGPVKVEKFIYVPNAEGKVKANQIQNTAIGSIFTTENVDKFITESVIKQLSFVGYSVDDSSGRIVSGSINEFMRDDLGVSCAWSLSVKYEVEKEGKNVYSNTFNAKTSTPKEPEFVQGAVYQIVRECIEKFLKDAHEKNIL
jgi:hypothetical protein